MGVPLSVVAKLVLAKEALADRGAALRSGNVRNAAGLLAGLDVFSLEVAAIGHDIDCLDAEDFAGWLCGLSKQAHVYDLVGHGLLDDQLILGVDRDLNVVADADLRVRGNRPAVWIAEPRVKLRSLLLIGLIRVPSTANKSRP